MRPLHISGIDPRHPRKTPTHVGTPKDLVRGGGTTSFLQIRGSTSTLISDLIVSTFKHRPSTLKCPNPTAQHLLDPKGEKDRTALLVTILTAFQTAGDKG